ncbi:GNAT family N-acetyltransferase [Luteimicrobium subarcticum]|uniref:Acetyltransferase (GNAT) family protein n=1 Tax=Luteimicrobium subarcticum TaxID=620910 RepID=A0A2M8WRR6_9MICO|nr:GNAT family N-acetyltransferase [Luteimicrobium subarcticum]PJI93632.1 acetyltransferase (GNAT) family protein [Luteimicrobium subarcticum]
MTTVTATLRPFRPSDADDLYDICVRTADAGTDARGIYTSDRLVGDLFALPYAVLEPGLAFVVDDGERVVGYVVGTADTRRFVDRYRDEWVPALAGRYAAAPAALDAASTPDDVMTYLHEHPERMLVPELAAYPAHLHVDLLPAWQGKGMGRWLVERFRRAAAAEGAAAVHVGMVTANTGARPFYDALGFHVVDVPDAGPLTYLGRPTR